MSPRPAAKAAGLLAQPGGPVVVDGPTGVSPSGHRRDGRGASDGPGLVPAIPTTGSGGIIPAVGISGTLSVLLSAQTGIDHIHTKRWDGQNDRSGSSHSAAWSQKNMSYQSYRTNGSPQPGSLDDMTS